MVESRRGKKDEFYVGSSLIRPIDNLPQQSTSTPEEAMVFIPGGRYDPNRFPELEKVLRRWDLITKKQST